MNVNNSVSKTVRPYSPLFPETRPAVDIRYRLNRRKRIRKLFSNNKLPGHSSQVKSLYTEFYLTLQMLAGY